MFIGWMLFSNQSTVFGVSGGIWIHGAMLLIQPFFFLRNTSRKQLNYWNESCRVSRLLLLSSMLVALQIEPSTVVAHHLQLTALLTPPQPQASLPLVPFYNKLAGVLGFFCVTGPYYRHRPQHGANPVFLFV